MKLSIAKIAKRTDPNAPKGRLFTLLSKQVPAIMTEDRARMEEAAKRRNDKARYPVFHEG